MQHSPSSSAAPKPRRRIRIPPSSEWLPLDPNQIKDPIKKDRLTKCATLAIRDYNSQTQTDYQLVVIDTYTWQAVNGILFHITFQARNADKEYATFEAKVLAYRDFRKVHRIRMKGATTGYNGTLMQLEDYAPILTDVKDKIDVYQLIKAAQQLRLPDVESLMIKQDEGEEAAGAALPE